MNEKQKMYSLYKENKGAVEQIAEKIKNDEEELAKIRETITDDIILQKITKSIRDIEYIDMDFDHKIEDNYTKVGIELEYEGCDLDPDGLDDKFGTIIETVKEDGSVRGDGMEINLKPVKIGDISKAAFRNKLENMMVKAADDGCKVGWSAGMHVHVSSNALNEQQGRTIYELFRSVFADDNTTIVWKTDNRYYDEEEDDYGNEIYTEREEDEEFFGVKRKISARTRLKIEKTLTDEARVKADWLQFLYSTSEREGFEPYGLAFDGTRGYTSHGTIEIRVWRTTLDFRKVIARAKIATFWVNHVCRNIKLLEDGYIEWKDINIWEDLKNDNEMLDAYKYLAFNCDNQFHDVGLEEDELIEKLEAHTAFARGIKERSLLIKKSLTSYPECAVKELFKRI